MDQAQREQERHAQQQAREREAKDAEGTAAAAKGTEAKAHEPHEMTEEEVEKARQARDQEAQKARDEAQHAMQHPKMIGMENRMSVPPPNAPARDVKAGPMTTQFAVGGLKIFQRYGKRYQVVSQAEGGVFAVDLEYSEPKPVVFMTSPGDDDYEEAPEA